MNTDGTYQIKPEYIKAIEEMRAEGWAVIALNPEQLSGTSSEAVETVMWEAADIHIENYKT